MFTYDRVPGVRNRLLRSSRFFYKTDEESQRCLSHTIVLVGSPALPRCLVRLKRSTVGREKRISLEKSRKTVHGRISAVPRPQSPSSDFRAERLAPARVRHRDPDMESLRCTAEPRSGCMGRFLGQGRRRGVVSTSERLWSPSFAVALYFEGFSGLSIAPPIPHPSRYHSTTLSQFPAYQHRLTHHIFVHLIAPEPP